MTPQQYSNLVTTFRRVEGKLDRIEDRLAFAFPTEREAREQLDLEIQALLTPGYGIRAFDDE